MRPLAIGILGAGSVALDHAAAVTRLGHRVVAAATRTPASPRWRAFHAACPDTEWQTMDDLLARPDLDALVVCLDWNRMEPALPRLLAHPLPMLLEKPVGLGSQAVAAAMAGACAAVAVKQVGFVRRYYAPVARLRQRLAQGGLVQAEITISENLENLRRRFGPEILPHVLAYSSCHHLDMALHLLGPLGVVEVVRRTVVDHAPFQALNGLLKTEGGVPVTLALNPFDPSVVGLNCRFDDHTRWHLGPMERLTVYDGYQVVEPTPDHPVRRHLPRAVEQVEVDLTLRPGFLEQMAAFLAAPGAPPAATVADSVRLLKLIEQLQGEG